jgi:hypothetical protein
MYPPKGRPVIMALPYAKQPAIGNDCEISCCTNRGRTSAAIFGSCHSWTTCEARIANLAQYWAWEQIG